MKKHENFTPKKVSSKVFGHHPILDAHPEAGNSIYHPVLPINISL
jgi:hypothetical protein